MPGESKTGLIKLKDLSTEQNMQTLLQASVSKQLTEIFLNQLGLL